MASYTEYRTLDITKTPGRTGQVKSITLRRGENDATEIRATLKDNGASFVADGYAVKFKAILPNDDFAEITGSVVDASKGVVSATVTNELTAVDGPITVAYFELSKGSTILTTDAIPIWVEKDMDVADGEVGQYQNHIDKLVKQLDALMADAKNAADAANAANEAAKKANENANAAQTASEAANKAAKDANDATSNLEQKVANGDFNGATFTPSVTPGGDLTWTNDKDLPNPATVNIKGEKGDPGQPGAVTNLASHEHVQTFFDYYVLKQQQVTPIIYVYLLGGDELKFSPKPITNHDREVTASWQVLPEDGYNSADNVPWISHNQKIKKISIEDIIIPGAMARWFYGFTILSDINDLCMIDVSNVKNFDGLFLRCQQIKSYDVIKNWDVSSTIQANSMFRENISLQDLSFMKNFNFSNNAVYSNMFYSDSSITDVSPISGFSMSKAKNMDYMFYGLNKVKDFTPLNNWDVSGVTNHTNCFQNTTGTRPTWGVNW